MSTDLTLPAARADRDQLAGRTDVLHKVRAFCQLPIDTHITTELVARFYGVTTDAIRQMVVDHRDELTANGFRVLTGGELRDFKSLSGSSSRAASAAVFSLRAVLNVGTAHVWHPEPALEKSESWRGNLLHDPGTPCPGIYEVTTYPETQQIHVRVVKTA